MELNSTQPCDLQAVSVPCPQKHNNREVITVEECKQYMEKFQLTDKRVEDIRNNMIGIVDQVINSYLKDFR